jgi:hypothetical protein
MGPISGRCCFPWPSPRSRTDELACLVERLLDLVRGLRMARRAARHWRHRNHHPGMSARTFRGDDRAFYLTCVGVLLAHGVPRDEASVIAGEITSRLGPERRKEAAGAQ